MDSKQGFDQILILVQFAGIRPLSVLAGQQFIECEMV